MYDDDESTNKKYGEVTTVEKLVSSILIGAVIVLAPVDIRNDSFGLLRYKMEGVEARVKVFEANDIVYTVDLSVETITCIAHNVYFEARNQSREGMRAVAYVVLNRVRSDKFPDDACSVITQAKSHNGRVVKNRCQFSWYCDGKPDDPKNTEKMVEAMAVAWNVITSNVVDVTHGATYYHASWLKRYPKWSKSLERTTVIDEHLFYR